MKAQYKCEHIVIVIRSFLKDISHLEIWVHRICNNVEIYDDRDEGQCANVDT